MLQSKIDMITVDEYIQTRNHGELDFTSRQVTRGKAKNSAVVKHQKKLVVLVIRLY